MLVIHVPATALMGRAEDPVFIDDGRQQEALISLLAGGCGDVQPASSHREWSAWAVLGTSETPSTLPAPMKVPEFRVGPFGALGPLRPAPLGKNRCDRPFSVGLVTVHGQCPVTSIADRASLCWSL